MKNLVETCSCKLGGQRHADDLKWTTDPQEGTATIFDIWNQQLWSIHDLGNIGETKLRSIVKERETFTIHRSLRKFVGFHTSLPLDDVSSANLMSGLSIPPIHSKQQSLDLPALAVEAVSIVAMRRNRQIPSNSAMKSLNHLFLLPLLFIPLLVPSVAAASKTLEVREVLFKGAPVPTVNWMSSDIVNFTWGLTGVDNFENLMFS